MFGNVILLAFIFHNIYFKKWEYVWLHTIKRSLKLRREFETLKMSEHDPVKEFADRILKIVNQIQILGEKRTDRRIAVKVLVSLPKKFEYKISSFEDTKDLSQISLMKLLNALQATKQKKSMRQKGK